MRGKVDIREHKKEKREVHVSCICATERKICMICDNISNAVCLLNSGILSRARPL